MYTYNQQNFLAFSMHECCWLFCCDFMRFSNKQSFFAAISYRSAMVMRICKRLCSYVCVYMHVCVHVSVTYTYECAHVSKFACIRTCVYAYMHERLRVHMFITCKYSCINLVVWWLQLANHLK